MLMHKSAGSIQLSYRYDYMDISNYTLMPSNLISLKLFISDNTLSRLENLPDEILLVTLSHIRWFKMIESFWSLNQRLILTQCYFTERLIENLSLLIQYQLNELILTFDKDIIQLYLCEQWSGISRFGEESNLILKLKEFVFKLFSVKCQLTTLDLDISNDYDSIGIHTCFSLSSNRYLNLINNKLVTYCTSLRCLRIRLIYGVFLEQIIERVPSLEILSVQFACSLVKNWYLYEQQIKRFSPSVVNW
ncbi:unnamed protein product [Rotaria socialis]|uniref:F-box domain-containing protein n=1 Tax=Rotaria socialis TaxID=392032 RepID=A0A820YLQ3_9BILA|nr:unnamed protein product [Rotaria socialis]